MKNLIKNLVLGLLLLLVVGHSSAQDEIYAIKSGTTHIGVYHADSLLNIINKNTRVMLNFETNKIYIEIDPDGFYTEIDTVDKYIAANLIDPITFEGKMDLDFYNPDRARIENFDIEGDLTINGVKKFVLMSGILLAEPSGVNISGKIEIHYDLRLADFTLPDLFDPFGEYACIEITQTLLQKRR